MRHLSISLLAAGFLSACVNTPTVSEKDFDPLSVTQSRLGPQNLDTGQCGLFLWGQSEGKPLQFFQNTGTKKVIIPFRPGSAISRIASDRQIIDGFFAEQVFDIDGLKMEVSLLVEEGRNVLKGIAVPTGRIVLAETSGREIVIPVVGLYGCRN